MNSFLKILYICLLIGGGISLLLGLSAGGAALLSSVDRVRSSAELPSADVDFYGLLALVCCTVGAFSLLIAKRIGKRVRRKR